MNADERIRMVLDAPPSIASRIDRILAGMDEPKGTDDKGPIFVTVSEAARICGMSRTSIWRLKVAGKIEETELMPGMRRLRRADILTLGTRKAVS